MKIIVISGSHRKNSESEKVAKYVKNNLNKIASNLEVEVLSLAENPIPLWEENVWSDDPKWQEIWLPVSRKLSSADAFVVVSPEWGGMVPSGLKNLFILCTNNELSHKPALIVAVSSGIGGSYPVSELRSSSYKNSRICYIPDHVIVRQVTEMLKDDVPENTRDENLRKRLEYSLKILLEYSKALKPVRESNIIDYKSFPYGM